MLARCGSGCSAALLILFLCGSGFGQDKVSSRELASLSNSNSAVPESIPDIAQALSGRPIRADVELVLVAVSVVDPLDRTVTGLTKDNFEVLEDRKLQQVEQFSSEDTPISLGIIFDTSGSMADKIDKSRIAVGQFLRTANPEDEFFLITFNDRPEKPSGFTTELGSIQNKLVVTGTKGQTSLLDAIYLGLSEMKGAKYARKALLVISDGGDNHSRYTENDVRKLVKESDVQIYSIGIFEPYQSRSRTPEELAGPGLLQDLSDMTGGREYTVEDLDEISDIAKKVSHEMRSVYVLAYNPGNKDYDGKWRKIQVKLRLPKQLLSQFRLFSKSGYYAPMH